MPHKDEINSYLFGANSDYIEEIYAAYLKDPKSIDSSWASFFTSLEKEHPLRKIIFKEHTTPQNNASDLYRSYGHLSANLDPLNIKKPRPIPIFDSHLNNLYCGNLGYEFMHLEAELERNWFIEKIENNKISIPPDLKLDAISDLLKAELFEQFLHTKFQGAKRFSIEGSESFVSGLKYLLKKIKFQGKKGAIIGMAHRGRLNTVANILDLPYSVIFKKFIHHPKGGYESGSGDVKYHMGATSTPEYLGGSFEVTLAPNPSHLESVNPVVLGQVKAKENFSGILVHGDASFMGQGVVTETLNLSKLDGYSTNGTIHIIINNQVGFTATPNETKSSTYCSDVMKIINAPVIHVNGSNIDAVLIAFEMASQYQHLFQKDIAIDLVCYRKYGHNETDEPMFTQPLMYKEIVKQKSIASIYGLETKDILQELKNEYDVAQKGQINENSLILEEQDTLTGVSLNSLMVVLQTITQIPSQYKINSKISRQLEQKQDISKIDWATGEAFSFGSLLLEGKKIRLSGQDSQRGTFSHRHSILTCQETGKTYTPLASLGKFDALNSSLSEFAVMGFEFGFSSCSKDTLVLWEAQFGDFANGAQTIIDQYISASESKWAQTSGLVLLLPHGYEGQGPEHSSSRFERYLQLSAQYNMQVVYPTTPANYFHVLRRQLSRAYQKPLVVITPKSLLRHKLAVSTLDDFGPETSFQKVISTNQNSKKLIFCTGKIYYDLIENEVEAQIIRLEQLYPFPQTEIIKTLSKEKPLKISFVQEEPQNMGAWVFLSRQIENLLKDFYEDFINIEYIGRPPSASTATGYVDIHLQEQKQIIEKARS